MSGLSGNGFEIKRQPEILEEIETDQKTAFGDDLALDPSSPDSQFNGLMSDSVATLWELGLEIYSGLDPRTASGIMLDRISSIAGIVRQQATPSVAVVALTGTIGAIIPAGTLFSADEIPNVKFSLDEEIILDVVGQGTGDVTADTLGAFIVAKNTIDKIETPVSGLDTVTNPNAGQTGIDKETDEELRLRRANSISLGSVSLIESIFSNVANVTGVDRTKIYENIDVVPDANGVPAHSLEIFARGGQDSDIAETIALKRSLGCGLHGTTTAPYTDSNGFTHDVKFSRPVDTPIFVKVTAKKLANWDINTNDRIIEAIVGYGNGTAPEICGEFGGYNIAEDVYASQLIFALVGVGGISVNELLVGIVYPASNQVEELAYDKIATFTDANVEIVYVP